MRFLSEDNTRMYKKLTKYIADSIFHSKEDSEQDSSSNTEISEKRLHARYKINSGLLTTIIDETEYTLPVTNISYKGCSVNNSGKTEVDSNLLSNIFSEWKVSINISGITFITTVNLKYYDAENQSIGLNYCNELLISSQKFRNLMECLAVSNSLHHISENHLKREPALQFVLRGDGPFDIQIVYNSCKNISFFLLVYLRRQLRYIEGNLNLGFIDDKGGSGKASALVRETPGVEYDLLERLVVILENTRKEAEWHEACQQIALILKSHLDLAEN